LKLLVAVGVSGKPRMQRVAKWLLWFARLRLKSMTSHGPELRVGAAKAWWRFQGRWRRGNCLGNVINTVQNQEGGGVTRDEGNQVTDKDPENVASRGYELVALSQHSVLLGLSITDP
jgi:hypothetical protein